MRDYEKRPFPRAEQMGEQGDLVLSVVEEIARRGAVSLFDLRQNLPARDIAIRQALDVLRDRGWVRRRVSDKAFEVTETFGALSGTTRSHDRVINTVVPVMSGIQQQGPFHVDAGRFVAPGVFKIFETTRRINILDEPLSLVDDDIALAGQLELSNHRLQVHLDAYARIAGREERCMIAVGEHQYYLRSIRSHGHVWSRNKDAVSVSCLRTLGFEGALCVSLKRQSVADQRSLSDLAENFWHRVSPLGPSA